MSSCDQSKYDGHDMGVRIASVFVMLVVSAVGAFFPLLAAKNRFFHVPGWIFFVTRYFGSGVIVSTAFVHLLGEAQDSLTSPCLGGVFSEYSWASGIALMGTFTMFAIEVVVLQGLEHKRRMKNVKELSREDLAKEDLEVCECETLDDDTDQVKKLVNIFLLEFGIVFHLVFVGLSLAISNDTFKTLFVAISFHQFFEGLGLGSRFATAQWPEKRKYVPWLLAAAYSITTPIGVAVGLGVRHLYLNNSRGSLIVVGVFDAFCAGMLIYNCLVELMAQDFLHGDDFKGASKRRVACAFGMLCLGAALMALIGKWA